MLCVVGDLVEDVVVRLDGPLERGTDNVARIGRRRGGSAANVAVAAAAAGCATRFIGRVGNDALADQLVADLEDCGVDVCVERGAGRTGSVVVLVDVDGERTMIPDRAEATELSAVDESWLDGVTWLHLPAYSLCAEPIGTTARALAGHVRGRWGRISIDVSSVSLVRRFGVSEFVAMAAELAPDVVFANADEASLVGRLPGALTVVKHGADPTELNHAGDHTERVSVASVSGGADTTGAGDAFAGGFLAALQRDVGPAEAAQAGALAAAAVLSSPERAG